jgi:hypothetical protein
MHDENTCCEHFEHECGVADVFYNVQVYLGLSGLTLLLSVVYALIQCTHSPLSAYEGDQEPQPSTSERYADNSRL